MEYVKKKIYAWKSHIVGNNGLLSYKILIQMKVHSIFC